MKLFSKLSSEQKDILERTDGRWVTQVIDYNFRRLSHLPGLVC